jgi:hypothetical protein
MAGTRKRLQGRHLRKSWTCISPRWVSLPLCCEADQVVHLPVHWGATSLRLLACGYQYRGRLATVRAGITDFDTQASAFRDPNGKLECFPIFAIETD